MKLYTPCGGKTIGVDEKGRGIVDINGAKPVKAFFTVPGDEVVVLPKRRTKGDLIGEIQTVTTPSPARVAPRCPYVGQCGGCIWQMIDPKVQREQKLGLVNAAFERNGFNHRLETIEPAVEEFYYRNRMDYVFGPNGELGLKEPGKWFSHLDLQTCFLLSPESPTILERMRAFAKEHALIPYNPNTGKGFLRYLIIREGKRTGERVIHLLTTSQQELPLSFAATFDDLATHIIHGVSDGITDISVADSMTALKGGLAFTENLNEIIYTIPAQSFFQTNSLMAEKLASEVLKELAGCASVLDLYCGVGFFALALAKRGIRTLGVEIDATAIAAAEESAKANGITLAQFTAAKSEDLSWANESVDALILDPPRAGLHPKVIKKVLEMKPKKIVYVSCKYSRFVEELKAFETLYKVSSLKAFDLFPHTPHLELVTTLELK